MPICPNCRHEVLRHSESNECGEPGCSCLYDPRGSAAFVKTTGLSALASVPLTPPPERRSLSFVFDHPFITLVILSLVILGLMTGINVLEKGPAAHAWMSHHGVALALFKGILCVFAVPGLFIMQVWVPGMKTKDLTEPGPRWIPYVIGALLIAALLYGAARIFLAAR